MALTNEQKLKLGQCLTRLVPGFDGQILAYKNHEIVWKDERPQPSEEEIIAEYDKILAEEKRKKDSHEEKENVKKDIKLLPPSADLASVIEAYNKLALILKEDAPSSGQPSNAVELEVKLGGKISKKGK
jgi:hypothetical protein